MKKTYKFFLAVLSIAAITSCETGLDELNQSKVGVPNLDQTLVLNGAIVNSSPPAGTLQYETGIVQQLITSNTGVNQGANQNAVNIGATPANWTNYYQGVIRLTSDVITRTKDDATRANLYNMARIIQANAFMVLTDTYGDIPYTEAGKGVSDKLFLPKYSKQQDIYPGIITELTQAVGALSGASKTESSDVLYAGDLTKWKKFGNSLLLRAGMRIMKAAPAQGQPAITASLANGGPILANADNAIIKHDANFVNPPGNTLNGTEAANFYLAKPFVDQLKNTNDPRLTAIAVRFVSANSGPAQVYSGTGANATTDPTNQYGMPMGSTDSQADAAGALLPGGGSRYAFSQADRTRIIKRTSANYVVTAAQTNLLLAEAAFQGYIPGGFALASTYFTTAIKAHMDQMGDQGASVPGAARDTYATANPLVVGTELQQINTQYWIASFLLGNEAWANFRRSGYPVLAPNPYPSGSMAGKFITKITYPPSEVLVNGTNVSAANASQGPDALDTKVWWNK